MPLLPQPTHDLILRDLSPVERVRFAKASKEARDAVSSYNERAFRIEKILSRYFEPLEIITFRKLQFQTGLLISGSSALQFFDCTVYDSDLDLYVSFDRSSAVIDFLQEIGYVYRPTVAQPRDLREALKAAVQGHAINRAYASSGISIVVSFSRRGQQVQLILCTYSSIQVILGFHSTCVLNVITHSHAYSFFPRVTFHSRGTIKVARLRLLTSAEENVSLRTALQKYGQRGWSVVDCPSARDCYHRRSELSSGTRTVGDSNCWVIPLSPIEGVDSKNMTLQADTLRHNSWTQKSSLTTFAISYSIVHGLEMIISNDLRSAIMEHRRDLLSRVNLTQVGSREIPRTDDTPQSVVVHEVLKIPEFPNVPYARFPSLHDAKVLCTLLEGLQRFSKTEPKVEISYSVILDNNDSRKPSDLSTVVRFKVTLDSSWQSLDILNLMTGAMETNISVVVLSVSNGMTFIL